MVEKVKQLFKTNSNVLSFNEIKKQLGISRQHKDEELLSVLRRLELDGKIYCDENNQYKKFPSNFFITKVECSTAGNMFITIKGKRKFISPKNLDGVLNFDTVVFERGKGNITLKKILERNCDEVVCEVIIQDKEKVLKVCNQKNNVIVRIDHKTMKKLVEGEKVLVKVSNAKFGNKYEGKFIKSVGHKNELDTELKTIAINNGFDTEYPDAVMEEIEHLPSELKETDFIGRVDKRNDLTFTIDGENTKDIDDAVDIKMLPNGHYLLVVSIAHVSSYVKPGSELWKFAERNTTSLYLVNRVLAMFHSKISNGICSLNPDEDRLARSFEMEVDSFGNVLNFKSYKSVIRSKKKMTYDDVNKVIHGEIPVGYEEYQESILLLNKLSKAISLKRNLTGAISLDTREVNFKVDDEGKITTDNVIRDDAERIIENAMIMVNACVGEYYSNMLVPFVYRNHELPITERVKEIYYFLENLGYRLEKINNIEDNRIIQKIIRSLANKEEFIVLSTFILQSMQRAYYSPTNAGHFGLSLDYYSQTTAPIRRFLDLVIHTLIDYYEEMDEKIANYPALEEYLKNVCQNASIKERCADKAEFEANQLYMVKYMEDKIGEEFLGFISNIDSNGIHIKTMDLIDGVCYLNFNNRQYQYYPESKSIYDKINKTYIHIGTKVKVRLSQVDLSSRQIMFDIIDINVLENEENKSRLLIKNN